MRYGTYLSNKGFYSIFTTWIMIVVLLASIGTLYYVNKLILKANEDKNQDRAVIGQFRYIRDRFMYCYGNVASEDIILSDIDCLGLKDEMGISIEKLAYAGCSKGHVKELNYRGYGKVSKFDTAIYSQDLACPARVTVYEHAVVVPLITNISVSPLFVIRPGQVSTRVDFYHTVFPSFISQKIISGSVVAEQESGPLFGNASSYEFRVNSTGLEPGIHYVGIGVTHDRKYWDENRKAGRFRVVPENDTPVYVWHNLMPEKGTVHDTFRVEVNISDYINLSWVAVAVENGSDALIYLNITRRVDTIDMEELVWHFKYIGGIPGSLLPNSNATYNVTIVAVNDLGNAMVKQIGQIRMEETSGLGVAIVGIRGYITNKYNSDEVSQLDAILQEYKRAITATGLNAYLIYLDSDELQSLIGTRLSGGPPYNYTDIDGVISQLYQSQNMSYMILIGGQGIFPMGRIYLRHYEGRMSSEFSDDLYADMTGDYVPDIAVGRLLDPINGDMQLLLTLISNTIRYHGLGGVDFSNYHTDGMRGLDSNTVWSSMTCFNQQNWGSQNPPNTHNRDFPCNGLSHANGVGFYALLLHGSEGKPPSSYTQEFACNTAYECSCHFYGGGTVPNEVAALNLDGATWMLMPCHGGHVQDKLITSESMPMSFHRAGGLVYIGSTNNNLGAAANCRTVAGVTVGDNHVGALYSFMSSHFDIGTRLGDAYLKGKKDYKQYIPNTGGKEYQLNINCYFGDPTLKIRNMW